MKSWSMVLGSALLGCSAAFAADLPLTAEAWTLGMAEARQQTLTVVEEGGKPTLQLKVMPSKFSYCELSLKKPIVLSEDSLRVKVETDLKAVPSHVLRFVSVRLVDASGEIFQMKFPVKPVIDDWVELEFKLTPGRLVDAVIFGGDKNRKIDFPVRFWGVTADFDRTYQKELTISLRGIEAEKAD